MRRPYAALLAAAALVASVAGFAAATPHAAAQTLPAPLRVMIIGDSITQGFPNPAVDPVQSWRWWFWQDRAAMGCGTMDLVGDWNTLFNTTQQLPPPMDQDHLSYAGAQIDGFPQSRIKYNGAIERGLPDVVLMLLGTNDLFNYNELRDSPETVRDQMNDFITLIRAHKPNVAFLVMGINPRGTPYMDRIVAANSYYQQIALTKDLPGSPIFYVDGFTGFNEVTDTFDHVHASTAGQHKISDRFRDAMTGYCTSQAPTTTTTTAPTTTTMPATTTTLPATTTTRCGT